MHPINLLFHYSVGIWICQLDFWMKTQVAFLASRLDLPYQGGMISLWKGMTDCRVVQLTDSHNNQDEE